ncbi:MAG: chromosomal replication initiator protein DnaA [Desulfobacteraceae bacterium]|nr:chromosomal replication initiator protein DnaA [Desulfobacteraceae bacterium]MCF8094957.1 chromosomal replication initiator protein DnaA [Desulfobacteraceae bacterium]
METVWKNTKSALSSQVSSNIYRLWIEPIQYVKTTDDDTLVLGCPNFFIKKRIMANYVGLINSELSRQAGREMAFSIHVQGNTASDGPATPKPRYKESGENQLHLPGLSAQPVNGRVLRQDYTFDRFVVGQNSNLAYQAAMTLASSRTSELNSLFLLSGTGMGKSHLSQAVGHKILSACPKERVFYISAEDFTNELVHSIKSNCLDTFKRRYRENCDVLLLEEIHVLSGRTRTQSELAMMLDHLYESGKKLIFSSCASPVEIPRMSEHLASRLGQSMLTVIEPPDFSTRMRILKRKAEGRGVELPRDVAEYMAGELIDNVRQLENGLIGVASRSCLMGDPIDLNLAEQVVKNIVSSKKSITVDSIAKLVGKEFGVPVKDMVSKSRKKSVVRPRQVAIFLARRHTGEPLQAIGRKFNRMHATVIHSINSVEKELKLKGELSRQVEILEKKLENGDD